VRAPIPAPITGRQEQTIRQAHRALDARGRGKGGIHTTTQACRTIRDLLDILAGLTGITSADTALPFGETP
jgi:hypothetical protein